LPIFPIELDPSNKIDGYLASNLFYKGRNPAVIDGMPQNGNFIT
jgi:hypothetical protein